MGHRPITSFIYIYMVYGKMETLIMNVSIVPLQFKMWARI